MSTENVISWTLDPRFDQMRPVWDLQDGYGGAYGAGLTALIAQIFDAGDNRYEFTGNQDIDGVLIGSKWTQNTLTFSFPTSGAFYANEGYAANTEPAGQVVFNAAQQTAIRYAFNQIEAYTNLNVNEITETASTHANFRFSQTSYNQVQSAYANFPSSSLQAGDSWFGMTNQPFYTTPAPGNWGQATMMHELGHALGLKHGHDNYTNVNLADPADPYLDPPPGGGSRFGSAALPSERDGQAWSLMTYRSDPGATGNPAFQGDGFNQPQTYMQDDIRALQHLYGADFTTNATATTYQWNVSTGEMSINGVGRGAPTSNKILATIWDGNGIDTYDLSNYSGGVNVDLNPGAFSTFSAAQLVNHRPVSGVATLAPGNIANALQFEGDARSLIENAKGGSGSDFLRGNAAANTLTGNGSADELIGDIGSDTLRGGEGADTLYGDGKPGSSAGIGMGTGLVVKPSGAGNNTTATAIDVTNKFSLADDADIISPTTVPHVTVQGTADGNKDYYKVTLLAGAVLTLDVDHTATFDSFIVLYDKAGTQIAFDDDSQTTEGAGGSTVGTDSFLTYNVTKSGTYFIEVGDYLTTTSNEPIAAGNTYELQISAAGAPGVGSGSGNDTLDGGLGADKMTGGLGGDTYIVDNIGDIVTEENVAGVDTVKSSVTFSLAGEYVEKLTLTGTSAINGTGNSLANTIVGNSAANTINGGTGADSMAGGGGNDTYFVDNAGDTVTEANVTGVDTVNSSVTFSLAGQYTEKLTLTGTAAINGTGNSSANTITGNSAANTINGGTGADKMAGGGGNDIYFVDNAGDTVTEANVTGVDTVNSSVTFSLAGQYVEKLTLTGTAAINGTGNSLANTIVGNSGANIIAGGTGNDDLTGGGGKDFFLFNTAPNASTNVDIVHSYSVIDDTFQLARTIFTGFNGYGQATPARFFANLTGLAHDADDRIIYDTDSGKLFYDADGTGATAGVHFATVATGLGLTNADFVIV